MGRKVLDTNPDVKFLLSPSKLSMRRSWDHARSVQAAEEFQELVKRHVRPHFDGDFDIEVTHVDDARCEHCNATWTEKSPDYNGGCCAKDVESSSEEYV